VRFSAGDPFRCGFQMGAGGRQVDKVGCTDARTQPLLNHKQPKTTGSGRTALDPDKINP